MLKPYADGSTHLLDELRWLNLILLAHVLRLRQANFYDGLKDLRGFFLADEEIDALFAAGVWENEKPGEAKQVAEISRLEAQAQQRRAAIEARLHASRAHNLTPPLLQLAHCFQLDPFEQSALLIGLAPQVDARYEKIYAYLQNDLSKKFPSIDLILALLCARAEERLARFHYFHPAAPLRRFGLLESAGNDSGVLRLNERILHHLLGNHLIDESLAREACFMKPASWEQVVAPEALRARLQEMFAKGLQRPAGARPVLYLHGRNGVGKSVLACALCREHNLPLLQVDLRVFLRQPENFHDKVRLLLRESLLQSAALCLEHVEKLESAAEESPWLMQSFMQELAEFGGIIFLTSEKALPATLLELPEIIAMEIPAPGPEEQHALWRLCLNGASLENESAAIEELTSRFNLTGGQIMRAARSARQTAKARGATPPTLAEFFDSGKTQSQPKLSHLARKITPKYRWEDLILPDDQIAQLRELSEQVRHRRLVMSQWGFAGKLSLGRGANALFSGPSGTGKTMSAEVVAHELGLDLYKIDLSAVVSKYIGETEKNLSRIFEEAQHSNAILFFDEADALFGKRSEVKDAHDRYANIEIAYLLQRMEEYEGIVILATNLGKNIDDAFVRRLQYFIEFPFPDAERREQIWRAIFPCLAPLREDLNFAELARKFKLSGGNIKNIGLKAAFCAAADGQVITMQHLLHATRRELQKMGKPYLEIANE